MNLCAIDINISDFGQGFNPSKLDYNNSERENIRRSVLNVLKKIVDLSNQNIRRNADGYLATVPHEMTLCYGLVVNVFKMTDLPCY